MARIYGAWESVYGGDAHFRGNLESPEYVCGVPIRRLLVDRNNSSKRKCAKCQGIVTPPKVRILASRQPVSTSRNAAATAINLSNDDAAK